MRINNNQSENNILMGKQSSSKSWNHWLPLINGNLKWKNY